MKKRSTLNALYCLAGGIAIVVLFSWWLTSFNVSRGYWEAEIENAGPNSLITIRLVGQEVKLLQRQIVVENIKSDLIQPGTFKLPDEVDKMPDARMTFDDITVRPGRVKIEWQGHEIDMMTSRLVIDGKDYEWDSQESIELAD